MKSLALFFLILVTNPSISARAECVSPEKVVQEVLEGNNGATATEVEAAPFMAQWNAIPPASNVRADRVIVLMDEKRPAVLALMFDGGCLLMMEPMPRAVFDKIMRKIEGGA